MGTLLKTYSALLEDIHEKHVNIFGAGSGAYYLARDILKKHKEYIIDSFIVSNNGNNVMSCFGIPVKTLENCSDIIDIPIIIGTLEWLHEEIYSSLINAGFDQIYALSDDEYRTIRQEQPDSEVDIFLSTHKILSIQNELKDSVEDLKGKSYNTEQRIGGIEQRIGNIEQRIANIAEQNFYTTYVRYNSFHEIDYEKEFKYYREQKNFDILIETLTRNLDEESVNEIYRILHRLNLLCDGGTITYCKEERQMLEEIHQQFASKIYNLGNRMVYKDYILPKGTFVGPSVFWYKSGIPQLKHKEYVGKKAIIDAGAYVGDSALVFSDTFEGTIYSFEFEPKNVQNMQKVIEWNKLGRVVPVEKALMDKCGEMEFYVGTADSCDYNSIYQLQMGEYEEYKKKVLCTTIDEFVKETGLEVGLIKADVEGAEKYLISGAKRTIIEQHPTLIISIYHSIEDFFYLKPLIESIYGGYEMQIFRPILSHSFLEETVLICEKK